MTVRRRPDDEIETTLTVSPGVIQFKVEGLYRRAGWFALREGRPLMASIDQMLASWSDMEAWG